MLLHTQQINKQQQKFVDLQKGAIISSTARPRFSLYNAPLVATTTTSTEAPKRNPILPNNAQLGPAPFRLNAQGFKLPSDDERREEDDIVMEAERFDGYRKISPQVGATKRQK